MTADRFNAALESYAKAVRADLRANAPVRGDGAAVELLLQPRFRSLVEELLPLVFPSAGPATLPRVLPERSKKTIGRPDIAFVPVGSFARAFIELKEPRKSLTPAQLTGHDKEQFQSFCNLPTWAFCNFHEIHLYARGDLQQEAAVVPAAALDSATSDAKAARLISAMDITGFRQILETLALALPPVPKSAKDAAVVVAHAARLVKRVVWDLVRALTAAPADPHDPIHLIREDFREILYARPAAGGHGTEEDFDDLFASAFAQTLAYGLLLAHEGNATDIGFDAYDKLDGTVHPLLKVTLQALLTPQVRDDLGTSLDVLLDTVNAVDPALMKRRNGYDPILYFYEDFLAVFDERMRTRYGVFFTPVDVVNYQVAAVDRALREELGTEGLLDESVLLLDPACGTGTYLISAAGAAAESARAKYGEASVANEIRSLAERLFGFEILVGPYTVAHYRLHKELSNIGARLTSRLHVYLADTLSPADETAAVIPHLGFMSAPIVKEREEADEVKSRTPILAILGNPPYRRLLEKETEELVGPWVAEILWEEFKKPVRDGGWGGELNTFPDLYIAFYRWALWKLFERPGADGRGVLSFISNRTFLTGHPFAGVRKCLRERFDRIEIVDLRGDRRGARPAGIERDENVFDTETGVCILTAWAPGRKEPGAEAEVNYADVWEHGAFDRSEKLALLAAATADPRRIRFVKVTRSGLDDFRPEAFAAERWMSLSAVFDKNPLGIQTKRDELVYGVCKEDLTKKIRTFMALKDSHAAAEMFKETGARKAGSATQIAFSNAYIERIAYRPFDIRYLYYAAAYIDRPRPSLSSMWGDGNVCLYAMPSGTGAGPAVFVHALKPDYHAFRGRGGYAFPLYDRRPGGDGSNVSSKLVAGLGRIYGLTLSPEEIFDFIVALLSAPSYAHRLAADLEDAFPHVCFPRDHNLFAAGVRIGRHIREIETLAKKPEPEYETVRLEGRPKDFVLDGLPPRRAWRDAGSGWGSVWLKADGSLRLEKVPEGAWQFSISGFQVLHKWLSYRKGQTLDKAMQRQLLDVVARIAELLDAMQEAEPILEGTLADPLARSELGF
ncbi:MAG: N-6 DNA methylase [Proteobacteria bacterium]|nr:N-6 DNA methylase [Pseudomonadota bacterium]